ncbi:uncharacterized protein (DUF58 family) [Bacillus thermophilus]|uniref:Uncharacterized protein (DUF58 family) n=1 Tax=Siminovitchia thermophila TaxID=1245522 RepID=A0ABS2R9C6_9BACI|nr:DUF58 domain-containing protein [Siminovitchia thermophila]MBM7715980.1 uncharacterized protein (DUF58 family) [Siminovitchia thermophila]
MTKLSKNWWGRFLFRDRGILPTKRLLILFGVLSMGLFMIGFFSEISWRAVIIINILLFLASLLDLLLSPKKGELTFERELPEQMERGLPDEIQVKVRNRSQHFVSYKFMDDLPQTFECPFPVFGHMQKESSASISYETTAWQRGRYEIIKLYVRYKSVLGLWEKQTTFDLPKTVKVIPDLTETKRYLESAQRYLLYEGTKIRKSQKGTGEFSQIRRYVPGDDPRMINWRQTAKLREVMTNEYAPEHGKYIMILIDCGRMMGAELAKGSRLERVLDAVVAVTAAALQKGDYVSVLAFSKEIKKYVPPAKGMEHLQTILEAIYDLEADPVEPNYAAVFAFLETVQKKRSLLLLFSDVRTFLHEEMALSYLQSLRRRHQFLIMGMEDLPLLERADDEPVTVQAAMIKSIAQQQILFKKREKAKWERQGLQLIEAPEESLAASAISGYIEIMNRNVL